MIIITLVALVTDGGCIAPGSEIEVDSATAHDLVRTGEARWPDRAPIEPPSHTTPAPLEYHTPERRRRREMR
ncbi:MAG: hypothetical protein EBR82_16860 [Caulobacteraceae bacterium]|nr:hypothetical protein [Caulobacteraceae bacterium]